MIDFDTTAEALLRLTNWWSANDVWGCGMAPTIGPSFEEAYVIRAALEADKTLHLGQVRAVAHAFCDRSLHGQDVSEENVYFMGYGMGRNENGQVCNSCVADAATVATAILETVKTYPDSAKAQDYIRSVRRFVDYVLDRYVDPDGVIGVGVLGYQVNPWTQYWCASSLFAETLLLLSEVTGEPKYLEAAVNPLAYMAQYDYRGSIDKNWSSCPDEVIFYAGEGIIAGLSSPIAGKKLNQKMEAVASESLTADSADDMMALNQMTASGSASSATNETDSTIRSALVGRWNEFAGWLYANQEMSGIWQDTRPYRGYQLGLSWLLVDAMECGGETLETESMINRQMRCMVSPEGKFYYGLFNRPWPTGLAHLSAARVATWCAQADRERFDQALASAQKRLPAVTW